MFTIMHERMDGSQELFKAVSVQFLPFTEENGDAAGLHLLAGPGEAPPGVRVGTLRDGNAFVMNSEGATVGRFYLDAPKRVHAPVPDDMARFKVA